MERVNRLVNEFRNQSKEYVHSRLEEELRAVSGTGRVDSERLQENALLMTELRERRIWPPS